MRAYTISVSGDVQGVNYRYFAKQEAKKLSLTGWVKNEPRGTVTVFVQGEADNIQKFVDWAKEGSPMATVEEVSVAAAEADESMTEFEVR